MRGGGGGGDRINGRKYGYMSGETQGMSLYIQMKRLMKYGRCERLSHLARHMWRMKYKGDVTFKLM